MNFTESIKTCYKKFFDFSGRAGVIEQVIMLGFILPATGWWFSFFALTAVWNLIAGGFSK